MPMAKRPFTWCKVKATSFGKEWAQAEYGRGYTTKYMYGKYTGPGMNAKYITAVWDDSTTCQAQLSKCEAVTMAEFKKPATKQKCAEQVSPFFPCLFGFLWLCVSHFLHVCFSEGGDRKRRRKIQRYSRECEGRQDVPHPLAHR